MGCGPSHDLFVELFIACGEGQVDAARLLLDKGADVNRADYHGSTPLHLACAAGHLDVARLLLEKGAEVDRATESGYTPLYAACTHGRVGVARLLLDKGADVNKADKDGTTPLHIVCRNGNVALAPPPIPPRSPGGTVTLADGTVIHSSVAPALPPRDLPPVPSASGDLLGLLLDKGAEVNRADKHGQTPLAIAKQEGHSAVVALLAEHRRPLPLGPPRPQRQQSDVQCSICLGPYKERAWTKCNHSFCRKCITQVCRTNPPTNRAPCPFCRQPVLLGELTRRPRGI